MLQTHKWDQYKYPASVSPKYCLPFLDLSKESVYHIKTTQNLKEVLYQIVQENLTCGTILHTTQNKYDTLVIAYTLNND